jgi:hypothetical protein
MAFHCDDVAHSINRPRGTRGPFGRSHNEGYPTSQRTYVSGCIDGGCFASNVRTHGLAPAILARAVMGSPVVTASLGQWTGIDGRVGRTVCCALRFAARCQSATGHSGAPWHDGHACACDDRSAVDAAGNTDRVRRDWHLPQTPREAVPGTAPCRHSFRYIDLAAGPAVQRHRP